MLYYKYNVKFSRDDVLRQELVKFRDSSIRAPFFIPYRERFVNENFYAIKGRSSFYYYLQKRPFAMRKRNKA